MLLSWVAWLRRQRLLGGLLAVVGFAAVALIWYLFVFTETGQLMEHAALVGSRIGSRFVSAQARTLLHVVSLPAAVALVLLILVVGLWRGSRIRPKAGTMSRGGPPPHPPPSPCPAAMR